jgi:hypothetical protein
MGINLMGSQSLETKILKSKAKARPNILLLQGHIAFPFYIYTIYLPTHLRTYLPTYL